MLQPEVWIVIERMQAAMPTTRLSEQELFVEVCSEDFLKFNFSGRGYKDQLCDAIAKTEVCEKDFWIIIYSYVAACVRMAYKVNEAAAVWQAW